MLCNGIYVTECTLFTALGVIIVRLLIIHITLNLLTLYIFIFLSPRIILLISLRQSV